MYISIGTLTQSFEIHALILRETQKLLQVTKNVLTAYGRKQVS